MKFIRLDTKGLLRRLVPLGVGIVAAGGVLLFRLRSLLPGLSLEELSSGASSRSLRAILHNPLNAPFKLPVYLLLRLHLDPTLALRGVAVMYGLLTLGCFYFILKRWQSTRVAVFGTLLFGVSSAFTQTARVGTSSVLLFGLVALVAAGLWLRTGRRPTPAVLVGFGVAALALYVPGLIWFALAGVVWRRNVILDELRQVRWWAITLGALLLLGLAVPLGLAVFHQHSLLLLALGLPAHVPALRQMGLNVLHIPLWLVVRGPFAPGQWVGRTPVLDVFAAAMFALGIYVEVRFMQLDRARLLLGVLVIGSLLIMLGGPVTLTLLIPFVYLIAAAGITYMLHEWFGVFPLNPIARGFGVGVITVAICASGVYQLHRSFVAWPHNPTTRVVFSQKPADNLLQ